MSTKEHYTALKNLASKDLSEAHLRQHFFTASMFLLVAGKPIQGTNLWSSGKPVDNVVYYNGRLYGTKAWVSGLGLGTGAVFVAKENNIPIVVHADLKTGEQYTTTMTPTLGMESTLTGTIEFNGTYATKLLDRNDPKCFSVDYQHDLAFLTNHIGLTEGIIADVIEFTGDTHKYTIQKIQLDLEILNILWEQQVSQEPTDDLNTPKFWDTRLLYNGFAKKILLAATTLWTEVTGSTLYLLTCNTHQRYKDALIYSTHFRSLPFSVKKYFKAKELY